LAHGKLIVVYDCVARMTFACLPSGPGGVLLRRLMAVSFRTVSSESGSSLSFMGKSIGTAVDVAPLGRDAAAAFLASQASLMVGIVKNFDFKLNAIAVQIQPTGTEVKVWSHFVTIRESTEAFPDGTTVRVNCSHAGGHADGRIRVMFYDSQANRGAFKPFIRDEVASGLLLLARHHLHIGFLNPGGTTSQAVCPARVADFVSLNARFPTLDEIVGWAVEERRQQLVLLKARSENQLTFSEEQRADFLVTWGRASEALGIIENTDSGALIIFISFLSVRFWVKLIRDYFNTNAQVRFKLAAITLIGAVDIATTEENFYLINDWTEIFKTGRGPDHLHSAVVIEEALAAVAYDDLTGYLTASGSMRVGGGLFTAHRRTREFPPVRVIAAGGLAPTPTSAMEQGAHDVPGAAATSISLPTPPSATEAVDTPAASSISPRASSASISATASSSAPSSSGPIRTPVPTQVVAEGFRFTYTMANEGVIRAFIASGKAHGLRALRQCALAREVLEVTVIGLAADSHAVLVPILKVRGLSIITTRAIYDCSPESLTLCFVTINPYNFPITIFKELFPMGGFCWVGPNLMRVVTGLLDCDTSSPLALHKVMDLIRTFERKGKGKQQRASLVFAIYDSAGNFEFTAFQPPTLGPAAEWKRAFGGETPCVNPIKAGNFVTGLSPWYHLQLLIRFLTALRFSMAAINGAVWLTDADGNYVVQLHLADDDVEAENLEVTLRGITATRVTRAQFTGVFGPVFPRAIHGSQKIKDSVKILVSGARLAQASERLDSRLQTAATITSHSRHKPATEGNSSFLEVVGLSQRTVQDVSSVEEPCASPPIDSLPGDGDQIRVARPLPLATATSAAAAGSIAGQGATPSTSAPSSSRGTIQGWISSASATGVTPPAPLCGNCARVTGGTFCSPHNPKKRKRACPCGDSVLLCKDCEGLDVVTACSICTEHSDASRLAPVRISIAAANGQVEELEEGELSHQSVVDVVDADRLSCCACGEEGGPDFIIANCCLAPELPIGAATLLANCPNVRDRSFCSSCIPEICGFCNGPVYGTAPLRAVSRPDFSLVWPAGHDPSQVTPTRAGGEDESDVITLAPRALIFDSGSGDGVEPVPSPPVTRSTTRARVTAGREISASTTVAPSVTAPSVTPAPAVSGGGATAVTPAMGRGRPKRRAAVGSARGARSATAPPSADLQQKRKDFFSPNRRAASTAGAVARVPLPEADAFRATTPHAEDAATTSPPPDTIPGGDTPSSRTASAPLDDNAAAHSSPPSGETERTGSALEQPLAPPGEGLTRQADATQPSIGEDDTHNTSTSGEGSLPPPLLPFMRRRWCPREGAPQF
jgi:hypothetical protein